MAAALSVGYYYYHINKARGHELKSRNRTSRFVILLSCRGREPANNSNHEEKKDMEEKLTVLKIFNGFERLGKRLKQNLSPQQKGDWKDLLLMSLSFAVYVYISQKLVCAYFAWTSMPKQLW
ncbi:hypothetical protein RIF29_38330 [Crotalaria pallida]|uniref:Uncharacterized protein n=1 Tax=Crotalaria pallida TaxID=3830 RepID=A0AAN9DZY9_CROPI